jgi:hypothetical protein
MNEILIKTLPEGIWVNVVRKVEVEESPVCVNLHIQIGLLIMQVNFLFNI